MTPENLPRPQSLQLPSKSPFLSSALLILCVVFGGTSDCSLDNVSTLEISLPSLSLQLWESERTA